MRKEQVSVPLTEAQRVFVRMVAQQETISEAAVIRRVVEAARRGDEANGNRAAV
jgi:hypothetical protein